MFRCALDTLILRGEEEIFLGVCRIWESGVPFPLSPSGSWEQVLGLFQLGGLRLELGRCGIWHGPKPLHLPTILFPCRENNRRGKKRLRAQTSACFIPRALAAHYPSSCPQHLPPHLPNVSPQSWGEVSRAGSRGFQATRAHLFKDFAGRDAGLTWAGQGRGANSPERTRARRQRPRPSSSARRGASSSSSGWHCSPGAQLGV